MSREIDNGITVSEFFTQILDNKALRQDINSYIHMWSFILSVLAIWSEQQFFQEMGCLDSGLI